MAEIDAVAAGIQEEGKKIKKKKSKKALAGDDVRCCSVLADYKLSRRRPRTGPCCSRYTLCTLVCRSTRRRHGD